MQIPPKGVPPTFKTSEDCLYLNVYAPPNATNLPVMVWIYGGSFVEGSVWNLHSLLVVVSSVFPDLRFVIPFVIFSRQPRLFFPHSFLVRYCFFRFSFLLSHAILQYKYIGRLL